MKKTFLVKAFFAVAAVLVIGQIFTGAAISKKIQNSSVFSMLAPSLISDPDIDPDRAGEQQDAAGKMWAQKFLSKQGIDFAHDKILKPRMAADFDNGNAVVIAGHTADLVNVIDKNPIYQKANTFIATAITDDFLMEAAERIANSRPTKAGREFQELIKSLYNGVKAGDLNIGELRKALLGQTRFVAFGSNDQFLNPYLYSVGDVASEEHRVIVAHAGRFEYSKGEYIPGGQRSIYLTMARLNGYMNRGERGLEAFRELVKHELSDFARGHQNENLPALTAVNREIDAEYKAKVVGLTLGERHGARTADTDKVSIEKYTMLSDLGTQEVFAIKGSSKVHPDVPKGSRRINVLCAKADVGSIGGHGSVPPEMLEAVADYWAKAAEEGKILDFFITRVGDDISVTVTHINGKDNEMMHKLVWDGFINATVISKDMGLYGAGQDLLKDSFSGNVKGAGPGITEMEFVERPSEPFIVLQADKCGPGVFNNAIEWIYADQNSLFVKLKPDQANKIKFGVVDFEHNNKAGREAVLDPADYSGLAFGQAIREVASQQTRYSFTNLTMGDEDVAGVTATRLHNIAGEYTGKDDPMAIFRTQKDLPAEGLITAPFFRLYKVAGWMMGSCVGYFMPVALPDAKIGVNDGPPLISAFGFNINNGRLVGFMDLFAANPAVRAVQMEVGKATIDLLGSSDFHTELKGRAPAAEMAYQKGVSTIDASIPWTEGTIQKPVTTMDVDNTVKEPAKTPEMDKVKSAVGPKVNIFLDLPLSISRLTEVPEFKTQNPPLVKPITLDDKTALIFGERATFGQTAVNEQGETVYEPGLGIMLPKFAKKGTKIAVIATTDKQRALITELNANRAANEQIVAVANIEEAKAALSTARYCYFKVAGDIEAAADDRSVTVMDVTGLVRRIIETLGHDFALAGDEIDRLQEAAMRFAQAA